MEWDLRAEAAREVAEGRETEVTAWGEWEAPERVRVRGESVFVLNAEPLFLTKPGRLAMCSSARSAAYLW
jgi:hypothetical protein